MKILAIDDMRDFPDADLICRTYSMGVQALIEWGPWDVLYLDHDLGAVKQEKDARGRELNGSRLMDWLESNALGDGNLAILPKKVVLVTANTIGYDYMAVVLDKLMFRSGPREWTTNPNSP